MNMKDTFQTRTNTVTESDINNLEKAKRYEKKKLKDGWKWKKVNERLTVFVPCDKNGNPTEHGEKMIKRQKERFSSYL